MNKEYFTTIIEELNQISIEDIEISKLESISILLNKDIEDLLNYPNDMISLMIYNNINLYEDDLQLNSAYNFNKIFRDSISLYK